MVSNNGSQKNVEAETEIVNRLRHEVHNAHFDRIEEIKKITGIDYDELLKIHKHRAMEVWHQQVREWVSKRRKNV